MRPQKQGYLFVPYTYLKKNKNSLFSTRFRLYKKKECERRRRYKVNTIKSNEQLSISAKKHRCSYCRGLYWSVAYYRGYMLCSYCFQKKRVIQYILFNQKDHDISLSEIAQCEAQYLNEIEYALHSGENEPNNETYEDKIQFLQKPYPDLQEGYVYVRDNTDTHTVHVLPLREYKCQQEDRRESLEQNINTVYSVCYDHEYWKDIALSTFL